MSFNEAQRIRNTGHRGAGSLQPHNTLVAFQKAIDLNLDGVELDVIRTKDDRLAIIHDDDLAKNTNGKGLVSQLTMEEIQKCDAGNGETVPTLDDVFLLLQPTTLRVHVELKGPNTEQLSLDCVRKHRMEKRVIYSSFSHDRLSNIKQLDPSVEVALLYKEPPMSFIEECKRIGGIGVDVHWKALQSNPQLVSEAHRNGIQVCAWFGGVDQDSEEQLKNLISQGLDNIITNRPDVLNELLFINKLNVK